jgi:hypothetical protein
MFNLFLLAEMQLQREGKEFDFNLMLNRAEKIRRYLDLQDDKKAKTQFKLLFLR